MAGVSCGVFAYPPLINFLEAEYGWRGASFILAGVFLQSAVFGLSVWPHKKSPPRIKQGTQANKVEILRPQDRIESNSDIKLNSIRCRTELKQAPSTSARPPPLNRLRGSCCTGIRDLMSDSAFVGYALAKTISVTAGSLGYLFMPGRAIDYGLTKSQAGWVVSVSGMTSMIGKIGFGFLTDLSVLRKRRCYVFAGAMTVSTLLCALSFHQSMTSQMTFAAIYGVTHGESETRIVVH